MTTRPEQPERGISAPPLSDRPLATPEPTGTAVPRVTGHGRILLVEDDDAVRAVVHRVLSKAGYVLFEARDAIEAQDVWHQHDGAGHGIDLVITDVIMPGATGHELVQTLRSERRDVPVLFTSGYLDGGETRDDDGGTTCYLEKPFTSRRLLDEVRALLVPPR
ncbi:MAG: response regulator [Gemmatimonadota bacterium]|nr:response regulator [Gemmatimonadota bacterium]